VERRRAADAICLHDPTINELRKKFCFRETKKCDFCIILFHRKERNDLSPQMDRMNTDNTQSSMELHFSGL
jgi:hypothetical protein